LCKSKNKVVAEYSLENFCKPIGISSYELDNDVTKEMREVLPNAQQLEAALKD
ncbi:MAG: DUF1016 domain-containing protein, partial [Lentisphaeria bacterium]|nr:DUF1016 domain-containing protein [Lentisphaeria bacterium]